MRKLLCALLALSFSSTLFAGSAFDAVCRARSLLAPGAWSRVVSVGLSSATAMTAQRVYGLVFEFNSILWLYRPDRGTESISRSKGDTENEVRDLAGLLREVFPRMNECRYVEAVDEGNAKASAGEVPNACFLKSVNALGRLGERGACGKVALLCYYYKDGNAGGHTVLYFETPEGSYVLDPTISAEPTRVEGGDDPLAVARDFQPGIAIATARFLPVDKAGLPESR